MKEKQKRIKHLIIERGEEENTVKKYGKREERRNEKMTEKQ